MSSVKSSHSDGKVFDSIKTTDCLKLFFEEKVAGSEMHEYCIEW